MKKRYLFPLHLDAGNRGCEAIALGTIKILGLKEDEYYAFSKAKQNDIEVHLNEKVSYFVSKETLENKTIRLYYRIILRVTRSKEKKKWLIYSMKYKEFLDSASKEDVFFITGGDLLCYGNNEVNYIAEYLSSKKQTVVLWGCSIGKENLTPEKIAAIGRFSLITARESLTYDLIKHQLGYKNVYLMPDPAFVLDAEMIDLPSFFDNDCVGINLSNFVKEDVKLDSIFGRNITNLLQYIIDETDYHIVLIPHVFWKGQDDRIISKEVLNCYTNNPRVHYLETERLSYCQIRYAISRCRFFIGARTHSMISAYAMKVPALALGYSVKSKGIAMDIGLPEYTVIDFKKIEDEKQIKERFKQLIRDETNIRKKYNKIIPDYIQNAYRGKKIIEDLKGNKKND